LFSIRQKVYTTLEDNSANGDWNLTFAEGESKNSSTLVAEHEFLGMKMRYERIK
jgi:hypothetical protein